MADLSLWSRLHVEIPIFLVFFAYMLTDAVFINLIIYQTCYVTLGYSKKECALLGSPNKDNMTDTLEKLVQPHATLLTMTKSFIEALFNTALCLFLGPWSDKFGRKPVLLSSLLGFTLAFLMLAGLTTIQNISPWFYLIASVPSLFFGGISSYLTVSLCYITDVTPEESRGTKMGMFEAALSFGILLGTISSSYLFRATSYIDVFLVSAFCVFLGLLYTVIVIPESVRNIQREGYIRSLFSFDNVSDMVRTTFKRRTNYTRAVLLICVLQLTVFILAINADSSVIFMYLREKFSWSLRKFTLYTSAHSVAWIIGTFIGIYLLHKLLKVPETVLLLMGYISLMDGVLLQALGSKDWHIYFAGGIRCLGGVISPMVRSLVSKLVSEEEVGKIFSLIVTLETLSGLIAAPLYTAIYNNTIFTAPEIFNYVTAGLFLLEIILTFAVIGLQRIHQPLLFYQDLNVNAEVVS